MRKRGPVMYVDDREDDLFLLRRAFKQAELPVPLVTINSGSECMEYLEGKGKYADREQHPLPSLVLIDLKMPIPNGFFMVSWLSAFHIPIIVVSSSGLMLDIERAKGLGASDYLIKPGEFDDWVKMVRNLHTRWLKD